MTAQLRMTERRGHNQEGTRFVTRDSYALLIARAIAAEDPDADLSDDLILDVADRMGKKGVKGLSRKAFGVLAQECYREARS